MCWGMPVYLLCYSLTSVCPELHLRVSSYQPKRTLVNKPLMSVKGWSNQGFFAHWFSFLSKVMIPKKTIQLILSRKNIPGQLSNKRSISKPNKTNTMASFIDRSTTTNPSNVLKPFSFNITRPKKAPDSNFGSVKESAWPFVNHHWVN